MKRRICIPEVTLLHGKPYIPSHLTDIRATFQRIRATLLATQRSDFQKPQPATHATGAK